MLTGPALGNAIRQALTKKGVTQKALAEHFGVKPPSVHGWLSTGAIAKDKLELLWSYFSDVAGPEHWGLEAFPGPSTDPIDWHTLALSIANGHPVENERQLLVDFVGMVRSERARLMQAIAQRAKQHTPNGVKG